MHSAKGFSCQDTRSVPAVRAILRTGARSWILVAMLLVISSMWFQGCVPSGQTQREPSPSPTATNRSSQDVTSERVAGPAGSSDTHPASPESQREQVDKRDGGTAIQSTQPASRTTSPIVQRKRDGVSVEKLTGYRMPAEYLYIPSPGYPEATVAVMLPTDYDKEPDKKYPLIVAFGGAGECAKPPEQGALAWLRYYKTDEAAVAAERGTLSPRDFRGLVTDRQLKHFNRSLRQRPYEGVILACPSSPPLWGLRGGVDFPEYEAFVMKELIPELQKRYRTDPEKIGIDGVSMGGARSLYYGLKYPAVFSSIGAVQGAFGPYMDAYRELIKDNKEILVHRPIQLVTSDGDVMLRSVEDMHRLLKAEHIPHRFEVLTGPHDYIFNQGPGALSLLLFHYHALAENPAGPAK